MIEHTDETVNVKKNSPGKRISWGAVFAGVVVALVTQLLLSMLGLGIGASTIDPVTEQNPAAGIGVGAGIWFVVSVLIALFAGGWVAGRLAGIPRKTDSALHGVLTWGSSTLITFFLLTTAVGTLISGAAGVLGKGMSLAGDGIAAAAPEIAGAVKSNFNIDVSAIKSEAKQLLRQTGKPVLQPDNLQAQATDVAGVAIHSAMQTAQDPQSAETELMGVVDRIVSKGQKVVAAADREALVNVLVARTSLSREEASATVMRWEKTYQQVKAEYDQAKVAWEQQAREMGQATASAVSKTAIWTFVIFLLGGVAAAFGGMVSTPRELITQKSVRPVTLEPSHQH